MRWKSLSCVQLFVTLWTIACQASLSFTIPWSLLRLMCIESLGFFLLKSTAFLFLALLVPSFCIESESCSVVSDSCDPMDYTVHGILQARLLEWVAVPFSRGSSQPRDWTQVSNTAGRFFTSWATREAHYLLLKANSYSGLWYVRDKAKKGALLSGYTGVL